METKHIEWSVDMSFANEFPFKITWEITERCNLDCKICYSNNEKSDMLTEYSYLECLKAMDVFVSLGVLYVFIDGGEPLLKDRFFDVLRECTKKFCTRISTNGTLIGCDEARKISDYNVNSVFVSLHGHDPETHDAYTQTKGSFADTLKGIENLTKCGVRTMTSIVLHKDNYKYLHEYMLMCKDLKVSKINLLRGYPLGRNKDEGMRLKLSAGDYSQVISWFESDCKQHGMEVGHSFGVKNHNCCDQAISLTADGYLRNCPYLRSYSKLGVFLEDDPLELWNKEDSISIRNSSNLSNDKCESCVVFSDCRGGCTADKMLEYGTSYGKDPLCWI